jgi:hypothetical protein
MAPSASTIFCSCLPPWVAERVGVLLMCHHHMIKECEDVE